MLSKQMYEISSANLDATLKNLSKKVILFITPLLYTFDDRDKVIGFEGSAADQASVHVGLAE